MYRIVAFILMLAAGVSSAQTPSAADLIHNWKIKKGWFGDENIVFELADTAKEEGIVQLYNFSGNGRITTSLFSKKNYGMCGNGMLYFDAATWKLNFKDVIVDISGGRIAESKFHYKMTYSVSLLSKGMLVLKLEKTELKEEKK
jgi:hypothetical protein